MTNKPEAADRLTSTLGGMEGTCAKAFIKLSATVPLVTMNSEVPKIPFQGSPSLRFTRQRRIA